MSLGNGGSGGILVPGSAGRRLDLDADVVAGIWLGLPQPVRRATLSGCMPASTSAFAIPASVPVGVTIHYAGFSWDPFTTTIYSLSETRAITTR
ncbi:MAG: hypothetical protein RL885_01745 [Planctomycetota bacterium]